MKIVHPFDLGSETPGPGAYSERRRQYSKRSAGFGSDFRGEENENPGPGAYDVSGAPRAVYGSGERSGRGELWSPSENPGAADYDVREGDGIRARARRRQKAPAFADRSGRWTIVAPERTPGPEYDTRPKKRQASKISQTARFNDRSYAGNMGTL